MSYHFCDVFVLAWPVQSCLLQWCEAACSSNYFDMPPFRHYRHLLVLPGFTTPWSTLTVDMLVET